uniref:Histone domain-containing protein n=1 Tax=Steinernema glaseri TaxID=37863 RepID=A0A1I7Y5R4_9BILA
MAPVPSTVMKKNVRIDGPTKKRAKKKENFGSYIFRILKQVHPSLGISQKSMAFFNSLAADMLDKIATEGARLCKQTNKSTLSSADIDSAIKLVYPGELSKHAVGEAKKALSRYNLHTKSNSSGRAKPVAASSRSELNQGKESHAEEATPL